MPLNRDYKLFNHLAQKNKPPNCHLVKEKGLYYIFHIKQSLILWNPCKSQQTLTPSPSLFLSLHHTIHNLLHHRCPMMTLLGFADWTENVNESNKPPTISTPPQANGDEVPLSVLPSPPTPTHYSLSTMRLRCHRRRLGVYCLPRSPPSPPPTALSPVF